MEKAELIRLILRAMLATAGLEEVQPKYLTARAMNILLATGNMVDVAEAHIQWARPMAKGQGRLMAGKRLWILSADIHMVVAAAAV